MNEIFNKTQSYDVVVSIVLYKAKLEIISQTLNSLIKTKHNILTIIVDNSPSLEMKEFVARIQNSIYIENSNTGFGHAHNIAISKYIEKAPYYLVLNPDVVIHENCLEEMVQYMNQDSRIALACPKILNPDGTIQQVYRKFPTLLSFFLRLAAPGFIKKIFKNYLDDFELKGLDFNKPANLSCVSGCFMFFRSSVLKKLEGFDTRFFLYFEDYDLSRRSLEFGKNIYNNQAVITHLWERGSRKSFKLMFIMIISVLKYFLKWGFILDSERTLLNNRVSNIFYEKYQHATNRLERD